MGSSGPTVLALEMDSAWVVVLAVSAVTLPAALLLRRVIGRPGGAGAGLLLTLPLLLPIVAALVYESAVLPELAVLKPVGAALLERPGSLLHVLFVAEGDSRRVTPYALSGSAGPWLLLIGVAASSFMLLRRAVGTILVRRLTSSCRPLGASERERAVAAAAVRLARIAGMGHAPSVRLLPPGVPGAFAVGARREVILLSGELLTALDEHELEGVLAHEIAHLEARDVPVAFGAGLLRDMVAWNPLAHVAFRRLLADRELEADRRAAAMTGRPLELASGLLTMCELMRGRRRSTARAGLAFLRPAGSVTRRVARLLALADGRTETPAASLAPYLVAAAVVAMLGLQAGARLAGEDPGAVAIVVGAPSVGERGLWAPKQERAAALGRRSSGDKGRASRKKGQVVAHPARYPDLLDGTLKRRDVARWMKTVSKVATRLRVSPITLSWEARALPIFDGPTVGPISILRMESEAGLLSGRVRPAPLT